MSILALKTRQRPQRSAAREALAERLNAMIGVQRVFAEAQNTFSRAQDLRNQAAERYEMASAAASSAKVDHAASMLRAARTGEPVAVGGHARDLRHAAADASDDLEAATAALASSEEILNKAANARHEAVKAIGAAADDVMAEALPGLMDAAHKAAEALFRACEPLAYLGALQAVSREQRQSAAGLAENVQVLLGRSSALRHLSEYDRTGWEAARAALASDPDAPLPEVA